MPRASKKKKHPRTSGGSEITPPLDPLRQGMPAQDSIISVKEMTRAGKVYRVIKTDEIDEYEQPLARGRQKHR